MTIFRFIRPAVHRAWVTLVCTAGCLGQHAAPSNPSDTRETIAVSLVGPASEVIWSGGACSSQHSRDAITVSPVPEPVSDPVHETVRKECTSSLFQISPGHIEISGNVLTSDQPLTPASSIELDLELFDQNKMPLPLVGSYLKHRDVSYTFSAHWFTSESRTPPHGSPISFLPPPYPMDGGWIPEQSRFARLKIVSNQRLQLDALTLRRTKWNTPLRERIRLHATAPFRNLPATPWHAISVNSQGLASEQLEVLQTARKHWKPRGDVQIIIQLQPEDTVGDRPSPGAIRVAKFLREWQLADPHISFGVSINPYLNGVHRHEPVQFHSAIASRKLIRTILPLVEGGAREVIVRADDFATKIGPGNFDYGLTGRRDVARYGTLQLAHVDFVNQVSLALERINPSVSVSFVPPWYSNYFAEKSPSLAIPYLKYIGQYLSPNVALVWTGPTVRSLWIDTVSVEKWRSLIGNRSLVIWDNTPYARAHKDYWLNRPERVRLCSSFEPYDIRISDALVRNNQKPWLLVNTGLNAISRIQLETAQVYLTDPDHYDAEGVLIELLGSTYGSSQADRIVELDQMRWNLLADPSSYKLKSEIDTLIRSMSRPTDSAIDAASESATKELLELLRVR